MNPQVDSSEIICRFAFESSKVPRGFLHPRAFHQPGGVSVSRIDDLEHSAVWVLGDAAGAPRRLTAIARGDLSVSVVRELDLDVVSNEPPDRHALIVGLDDLDKERAGARMKQLAAETALHLR